MSAADRQEAEDVARKAARALDTALKRTGEGSAIFYRQRYSGPYYVIEVTGTPLAFAYHASAVDVAKVSASDWNRAAWHASVRPVEDLELAVNYYMLSGGGMLGKDDGTPVLSKDQIKVLDFARGINDRESEIG